MNPADVDPEDTVTDAGVVRRVLLSARVTVVPAAGAALLKVTVHAAAAPEPRLAGEQPTEETVTGAIRLIVAVCEVLPSVAVTMAF